MARRGERDRGKERFWRRTLRQWRRSRQTIRDFCAEHGLSEPSFYAWRRIIAERERQASVREARHQRREEAKLLEKPVFVPLQVVPTAMGPLEVVLGQGRIVRVPPGFDAATLRQLLAVLEEPSC